MIRGNMASNCGDSLFPYLSYAPNTGPAGQELAGIAIQLRSQRYMVFELVGNQINLVYEGFMLPSE
jgi:hypothetical protein